MKRPAVFLDRDGTMIEDVGYIDDPEKVKLIPGVAEAIRRMAQAGQLIVIASNQSGIARGLFDEKTLSRVHARLEKLLHDGGAHLDGTYYCPYLAGQEATVKAFRRDSELRKPRPGLLRQAARELNIDLKRSWMIGDSSSDVEAGARAGCRTIRICRNGTIPDDETFRPTHRVRSLSEAAEFVSGTTNYPRNKGTDPRPRSDRHDVPRLHDSFEETVTQRLEQIQNLLDRAHRRHHQQDFSLLRLLGTLFQMLAMVCALWGIIALFDEQTASATARLVLAVFLQLLSVSVFAVDRFR